MKVQVHIEWMEELDASDMRLLAANHFPAIPSALLERMIGFARALQRDVVSLRKFGSRGAPSQAADFTQLYRQTATAQAGGVS